VAPLPRCRAGPVSSQFRKVVHRWDAAAALGPNNRRLRFRRICPRTADEPHWACDATDRNESPPSRAEYPYLLIMRSSTAPSELLEASWFILASQ